MHSSRGMKSNVLFFIMIKSYFMEDCLYGEVEVKVCVLKRFEGI